MPARAPLPEHGTRARYIHRREPCRCEECKAANAAYLSEYRRRRPVEVHTGTGYRTTRATGWR